MIHCQLRRGTLLLNNYVYFNFTNLHSLISDSHYFMFLSLIVANYELIVINYLELVIA
jgi:hypothetical protein